MQYFAKSSLQTANYHCLLFTLYLSRKSENGQIRYFAWVGACSHNWFRLTAQYRGVGLESICQMDWVVIKNSVPLYPFARDIKKTLELPLDHFAHVPMALNERNKNCTGKHIKLSAIGKIKFSVYSIEQLVFQQTTTHCNIVRFYLIYSQRYCGIRIYLILEYV